MGYSPWGCKESDTTEQLNFHYFVMLPFPFLAALGLRCCMKPFSCFGLWAVERGLQKLRCSGLVAPLHMGSSQTRDWTHVPCHGRWILIHWTTREALVILSYSFFFPLLIPKWYQGGSLYTDWKWPLVVSVYLAVGLTHKNVFIFQNSFQKMTGPGTVLGSEDSSGEKWKGPCSYWADVRESGRK